jgi:polysaccharide deacetylase 2 family uncharacterized protein YibQ
MQRRLPLQESLDHFNYLITLSLMSKRRKKKAGVLKNRITIALLLLIAICGLLIAILVIFPVNSSLTNSVEKNKEEKGITPEKNKDIPDTIQRIENRTEHNTNSVNLSKKPGRIAIIIDDVGNDLALLKPFLEFPGRLTIAVLPELPFSREASEQIYRSGKEVILHLPMQPLGNEKTGPGGIDVTMNKEEIMGVLEKDFASVLHAKGINNHMGSLATQDRMVMDALFSFLKNKNKYFVDSKTINSTISKQFAHQYQVPIAKRNFFLDSEIKKEDIAKALEQGVGFARMNGNAVLIGHVQNREVINVLMEKYRELVESGILFVTVSEIVSFPEGPDQ